MWKETILYPSTALITGKRGSGKSALGYWLLEYLSDEYNLVASVFGLPDEKKHLLPDSILHLDNLDNLPEESVILFDEAHLKFYSRRFKDDSNEVMDQLITISRQKSQILIFATHESRKLDKNVVSSVDAVILKEPGLFQREFERRELRNITDKALNAFESYDKKDRERYAYVYSSEFIGMLENRVPSFWSEELSRAFAGIPLRKEKETKPTWRDMIGVVETPEPLTLDQIVVDRLEPKKTVIPLNNTQIEREIDAIRSAYGNKSDDFTVKMVCKVFGRDEDDVLRYSVN